MGRNMEVLRTLWPLVPRRNVGHEDELLVRGPNSHFVAQLGQKLFHGDS